MSYTTHSYGLYNPQLWVIKVMLMIGKTSAHDRENICSEKRKHVRTFFLSRQSKKSKASFVFWGFALTFHYLSIRQEAVRQSKKK